MDQSMGFFGLVGMLIGLANISGTGSTARAMATGKAWLQAINMPSPKLGSGIINLEAWQMLFLSSIYYYFQL